MSDDPQFKSQKLITGVAFILMVGLCVFGLLFILFSDDKGSAAAEVWSHFKIMALTVVSYLFGKSGNMER